MANSRYEYVRSFEQTDILLANTWIVVRIDGRGFSKFTNKYEFVKPNDRKALDLMNAAAEAVMKELPDLLIAYGNSDEYSFVFHKDCNLFERRASKLTTTIVSTFTSYYVFLWSEYFPEKPLTPPLPSFDGRAICYPSDSNVRDYMSWRQVDCHINNLYNTTFWALVQQGGMDARAAEQRLSGTVSSDKNEILYKQFGINYNNEPECFKKGTVLYRDFFSKPSTVALSRPLKASSRLPTIAHPRPQRASTETRTAPAFESSQVALLESPGQEQGPGATFLSTSSTPSPPPSPCAISKPAFPDPLRANLIGPGNNCPPLEATPSSPSTISPPYSNMIPPQSQQVFPSLMPIPIPPLTLKPSTRPPTSLNAPNPTTRTNFSPTSPPSDFPSAFQISGYSHKPPYSSTAKVSHSASVSMSTYPSITSPSMTQQNKLRHRSPSQPHLPSHLTLHTKSGSGPPYIPVRMSSIPSSTGPQKVSLHESPLNSTIAIGKKATEVKEHRFSSTTPWKLSPPLCTNKELPSPPLSRDEELRTREKVKIHFNSPLQDALPRPYIEVPHRGRTSGSDHRNGQVFNEHNVMHPGIAELPTSASVLSHKGKDHPHLCSSSDSALLSYPHQGPDVNTLSVSVSASSKTNGMSHLQPSTSANGSPEPDDLLSIIPAADTSPAKSEADANDVLSKTSPGALSRADNGHARSLVGLENKSSRSATRKEQKTNKTSGKLKEITAATPPEKGGRASTTQQQQLTNCRPVVMSRTQRDKDRKKRIKAKIIIEHIDIIKDDFWEKRPWILSGRTG